MIELTVKTLDSQNHAFSVPDDTTVKQLKERIAESISFPVESQRLIYCGRVLQDEKNLSEYDVNGKVIHLVQRPPPQASRSNGGQPRSSSQQSRRGARPFTPRLDGNAMYLGAMAFPADLMDAQGIQAPPSSHSLSDSRLLLAKRMLRRASTVLNRLENPSTSEPGDLESPPEEPQDAASAAAAASAASVAASAAASAASFAATIAAASAGAASGSSEATGTNDMNTGGPNLSNISEGLSQGLPLAQAAEAATAAAIAAAVSAAHAAGVPNITIVRSGQSGPDIVDVRMEGDEEINSSQNRSSQNESTAQNSTLDSQSNEVAGTSGQSDNASTALTQGQTSTSNEEVPRTTVLADLLDELNRVNHRLQPFMQQYHGLMREYPNPENNATTQESQRVFGSVSEVMHFLSHAYHALSDIMCDFNQPPPRALRCRPVLIQHSAVLQAGIPIQAQINVMTNRNNANNNNNVNSGNSSTTAPVNGAQGNEQASGPLSTTEAAEAVQEPPSNTPTTDNVSTSVANQEESRTRESGENQEAAFNITPGNVEFFMEVGPGSITIDSLEATVVTNSGSMGGDGIQANVVGGFPWGAPPPPEFIQNLMHAVAGHMIGRGGANTSNATTNQVGTGASNGAAGSGQNSQARGNTATHPTTSTQTRSTSRPHVHLAPATMQGLGTSGFDPFLPCNSHHIRLRARQNAQSFTQQLAAAVSAAAEAHVSNDLENVTGESQQSQSASESQSPVQPPSSTSQQPPSQAASQTQMHTGNSTQASPNSGPSQSTPNAQSSHSSQSQQLQSSASSAFRMLSQIFNMTAQQNNASHGAGSQSSRSQSSGSQAAGGATRSGAQNNAVPPFPPGITFFNFGAQPRFASQTQRQQQHSQQQSQQPQPEQTFFQRSNSQPRESREPFNNPMLSQLFQGMSNIMGSELFNLGNMDGSIADFLMNDGEHGYRPGASLFLDFLMIMARNMSFGDIISLSFGDGESLNRIRPQLRQFILETAFENQPVNPESTNCVVERIITEMRPQLQVMQQARLREDVNLITSTIRYNQIRLPEVIALIVEGSDVNFGQSLVRWFTRYIRELSAIVLHCCLDGEQGLDQILRSYATEVTRGIPPAVQLWTVNSSVSHMQSYVRRQNVPFDEIREYLVYRVLPAQADSASQRTSSSVPSNMKTENSPAPEPMDTDPCPEEVSTNSTSEGGVRMQDDTSDRESITPTGDESIDDQLQDLPCVESSVPAPIVTSQMEVNVSSREVAPTKRESENSLPSLAIDGEPLPDVVLGSEAWHNVLPSEWVPIIARDSQRQRRQSPQAPFSDAYLSGMPSKRRKVVTSTKPQGNLNQIITDSMRSALDEAGIRPVAGVETAGEDLELQAAYREQVRSSVQDSLASNPDFTPERFPNATKYFSK